MTDEPLCFQGPALFSQHRCASAQLDGRADQRAVKSAPERLSCSFNGEPCMSDKLLIDLWGASISADGVVAIVAAVIIVVAFVRWRL